MGISLAKFATLTQYNSASLTTSFQALFTTDIAFSILQIANESTQGITLSFDAGVTSHWFIPAGAAQSFDLVANEKFQSGDIYVKAAAGGTGNIYLMGVN